MTATTPASESHGIIDLPMSRWTLPGAVRAQADRHGDREFLSFEGGESMSFASFDTASDRVATALADLGVGEGDRVLALLTNSRAFLLLMIGTHKRRAIFTPINTELKGAFLQHQVHNSEPRVVVADSGLVDAFADLDLDGLGIETTVIAGPDVAVTGPLATTRILSFDDLVATDARDDAVVDPAPSDVCTIMYTSGTTGPAKGVLLPQAHCYLFGLTAAEAMGLTAQDRYYVCMPLFHANGLFMQVYSCLAAGASGHVVRHFSASSWLDDVIACGATMTNALGVMPEFIYRQDPTDRDRDHALTKVMAIPVGEEWGAEFESRFGVRIVQGFGMTEVNMVAYSDPADPVMAGCAGRVLDEYFEVVIADPDTDTAVPANTIGEILVRPRHPFCFNVGYFKMPDRTVEAWRNLWFHTGDAAYFDDDGRLFFVDRIKDRIRRRGENISSYEIEQVLNDHPAVVESAVVGVKVDLAGGEDEIKAVVAVDGTPPDPVEFLDWCVPRMPRYAVPRFVEFVTELDKTASGKIRKQALRDGGVTDATWDRDSVGYTIARSR